MVASTYVVTSLIWWSMERYFKSVYALSALWFFFGLAFLLIGVSPFAGSLRLSTKAQDAATCFYAAGASSGALTFALNFDEGRSSLLQMCLPPSPLPNKADILSSVVCQQNNGSPAPWPSLASRKSTALASSPGALLSPSRLHRNRLRRQVQRPPAHRPGCPYCYRLLGHRRHPLPRPA